MRNKEFKMPGPRTILGLSVLVAAAMAFAAPCAADPKAPVIVIKIKRSPDYRLDISHRGVGVCKNGDEDCATSLVWKAGNGSNGPKVGEQIRIKYKESACSASMCFADTEYLIDKAHPKADSGPVSESCPTPSAWFYDVELLVDGEVVFSVDPGVIIDRGRRR
jgi:hypothetical protein